MADLSDIQAAGSTKIVGSDATGLETTPLQIESDGKMPSRIYALDPATGNQVQLAADKLGRLYLSPGTIGTKVDIVNVIGVNSGITNFNEYIVPAGKTLQLTKFYSGGKQNGAGALAKHDASATSTLLNGTFESAAEVSAWSAVTGTFTAPTPDSSTVQKYTGTASMRWTYSSSGTALQRKQTFATPIDVTSWRYISVRFFNDATTATTRTISIVLGSAGATRTYSLSGTVGTAPFTANTWVYLQADIENPTSITGTGFDPSAVTDISLVMKDANNKAGTVYWDNLIFEDSIQYLHRAYFLANYTTPVIEMSPSTDLTAGESLYIMTQNGGTARAEFTTVVKGILV